ncbi:MAG: hypothetical protein GY833_12325 [Aestuariibacter sp.]|nr:hypothetical protein [Aestuariibacter sp.]
MTVIATLLESTEDFITGLDFDKSAELNERRLALMKSKTNIHIEDFKRVEDLLKFKNYNFNVYSADGKYMVKWDPWGLAITDITDAMQAGKSVKYVELDQNGYESLDSIIIYLGRMAEEHGTIEAFMNSLTDDARIDDFDLAVRIQKGKNIFNPVTASKLKRVARLPNRWSVDILARVIANGQFKSLATGNQKRVTDFLAEVQGLVQGDGSIIMADNKDTTRAMVEYYNQHNSRRICEVNLGLG